jgi:hypothetical protein
VLSSSIIVIRSAIESIVIGSLNKNSRGYIDLKRNENLFKQKVENFLGNFFGPGQNLGGTYRKW